MVDWSKAKAELVTIRGVPPGTGTKCKPCGQGVREQCWLARMCADGLDDIGESPKKEVKR